MSKFYVMTGMSSWLLNRTILDINPAEAYINNNGQLNAQVNNIANSRRFPRPWRTWLINMCSYLRRLAKVFVPAEMIALAILDFVLIDVLYVMYSR